MELSDNMNERSERDYITRLSRELDTMFVAAEQLEEFAELATPVYQHFIDKGVFSWNDVTRAKRIVRGGDRQAVPE